jgi:two-component system OmpR family response regulator
VGDMELVSPLLVVGPNSDGRTVIASAMKAWDFDVVEAPSNNAAVHLVKERRPFGVVCTWPAQGIQNGLGLLHFLRHFDERMLIVVIGVTVTASRVREHLQAGADLCLPASYDLDALAVHMEVGTLRRQAASAPRLHIGDLMIDIRGHRVWRGDSVLSLTPIEFRLLVILSERVGEVVPKTVLFEECWRRHDDPRGGAGHLVEVHINALRRKLHASGPPLLHTAFALGYVLRPPDE